LRTTRGPVRLTADLGEIQMADRLSDPIELYRARGLPEAHAIRLLLEGEGVPVRIENELLQGAVGELPLGWATAPRVVVGRAHAAAARALLEGFLRRADRPRGGEDPTLCCLACGAAMGEAETCPACGWSYGPGQAPEGGPAPSPVTADGIGPDELVRIEPSPPIPGPTGLAAWAEVAAVLAVGVIPNIAAAVGYLAQPTPPPPYWVDTLQLTVLSACSIYVTLYLIRRSGEPWARFGITRPGVGDVFLGLALVATAWVVWQVPADLLPPNAWSIDDPYPQLRGPADYVLMALKYAVAASAEEIVCRAYLITRLTRLLGSRAEAILLAAVLFASYHAPLGLAGAVHALLFGVVYGVAFLLIGRVWPLAFGHAVYNIWIELLG
jgi:membrane protease YdiL (CAAX protease family)